DFGCESDDMSGSLYQYKTNENTCFLIPKSCLVDYKLNKDDVIVEIDFKNYHSYKCYDVFWEETLDFNDKNGDFIINYNFKSDEDILNDEYIIIQNNIISNLRDCKNYKFLKKDNEFN